VTGSYEHSNEPSASLKCGEFNEMLRSVPGSTDLIGILLLAFRSRLLPLSSGWSKAKCRTSLKMYSARFLETPV